MLRSTPSADLARDPDEVRAMFDRIAPTYDTLNKAMSAGLDRAWRARAIGKLPARGPILDVCAGTLDLAAALRRARPDDRVVALDFSAEMLERGKHKAPGVEAVVGDATALPFEDETFAGAICGFGIRNVEEPAHALAEVRRVLRPGGIFVTLELFKPATTRARLFHSAFERWAPALGGLISRDRAAYVYLARSIRAFHSRGEYEALLRREGFVNVRADDLTLGIASIVWGERR